MKRLSQTWRQKHKTSDDMPEKDIFSNITDLVQEGTPRRSQRLAKSKTPKGNSKDTVLQDITKSCCKNASGESKHGPTNSPSSSGQCSLFNSSFGFEFDADALSAVDKMEKEHLHVKKRSPLIPGASPITPICPKRSSSPGMFSVNSNAKVLRSTPKEAVGNENAFPDVEKIGLVGQYSISCSPDKAMDTGSCGDNIGHFGQTCSDEPLDTRTHRDNKRHREQSCSHDNSMDTKTHRDNEGQLGQSCLHDKSMDTKTHRDNEGQLGQSCLHDKPKDTRTHGDNIEHVGQSCSHDKPMDTRTCGDHKGHLGQSSSHNNLVDTRTCGDKQGQLGQSHSHDKPMDTRTCGGNIGYVEQSGTIKDLEEKLPKSGKYSENLNIPEKRILESSGRVQNSLTNPTISDQNPSATKTDTRSSQEIPSERCLLSSWDLPDSILKEYEKIGIKTMFEWQAECLCTGNVLNGGNLVYSAPTSAGKTMVAELLMLKRILEMKCKALFILPFVSVAREKMFYLQRMFQEAGIKVDGYMGSQAPTKGFNSIDIAVCTIEKANGLVNRLMEEGRLHTVGAIVVDEMHLLGDPSRGYLLELLLTKVLYMAQASSGNDGTPAGNVQIIGMSATLPNLDVLAKWLRADLFFTNYRPVPLTETFKVGPVIYGREGNKLRELSQSRMVSGDDDHVLLLCQETVGEGHAVLMFCPTKSWCEKLAESVARHFYNLGSAKSNGGLVDGKECLAKFDYDGLRDVFEQLKSCQVGLDSVLSKTLRYGVAYHHAGLTFDERDIIEGAFRQGLIKVLIATSTLSSGVNLPARRVIIRTPIFHGKLMDGLVYKQMSGRAGRKGVDSQGESILICKPAERQKASTLLQADLKPVESCLVVKRSDEDEGNGIKRALLEVIASGVATTPADVQRYASCTFYVSSKVQEDGRTMEGIIESTVEYLARNEFITLRKKEDAVVQENSSPEPYVPTQLGQATLASSLSPDEALVVFADLRKARKCFVLENELHIIYQVTPIYVQDHWPNLDWLQYLKIWEQLPSHMKRVGELIGIEERFLSRAIRGRVPMRTEAQRRAVGVHKRFYVSLALQELVREAPLDVVARKFGASRGMLQSLQSSAATFAGMVTVFCQKLGWLNLNMLLSQFHSRLIFGVERELVDLVRISAMNGFRARLLYNAGYHTVAVVASASPVEIEKHLRNATPFQSKKRSEWESERDLLRRMRAKCVWVDGRRALSEAEASREIVGEAREILKREAAKLGMEWKPDSKKSSVNILKGTRADLGLPSTSCSQNTEGTSTSLINGAEVQNVTKTRQTVPCTTTSVGITSNTPQTSSNVTLQAVPRTTASAGIAPKATISRTTESTCITTRAVSHATERISSDPCTVPCKSGSTSYAPRTGSSATQSTTSTPRVVPRITASTTIASRPILPSSDAIVSRDIPCTTESTSYAPQTGSNAAQSTTSIPRAIPHTPTSTSTINGSRIIPFTTTTTSTAIVPRDVPCTTENTSYASLTSSNATQSTTGGTPRTIRHTATSTNIASRTMLHTTGSTAIVPRDFPCTTESTMNASEIGSNTIQISTRAPQAVPYTATSTNIASRTILHTTSSTAIVPRDFPCTTESTLNASQLGSNTTQISTRAPQAVPYTAATSTNIASRTILHTTSSTAIVPRNVPCTTESTSNVPRTASNATRGATVAPVAVPPIATGTVIAPRTIPRITAILPSTIESTTTSLQTASHMSTDYPPSSTTSTVTKNTPVPRRTASEFSRSTSDVDRTSTSTVLVTIEKSRTTSDKSRTPHSANPGLSNGSVTVGNVKLQNTPESQEKDGRSSKRKRSVCTNSTVGGSDAKRNMVNLIETNGSSNVPPRSDYPMLANTENKTTKNVDRTGIFTPGKSPSRKTEPGNNILQVTNALIETDGWSKNPPRSDYPKSADAENKTTKNVDSTGTFTPGKCPGRKIDPNNNTPEASNDTAESISFHNTSGLIRTPHDKKSVSVILDESPELICISESASNNGDSEAAVRWSPPGDVEGKNPTETFSPELYSEALFSDYESPKNHSSERPGIVSKMSESCGFEMLGTSLEEYAGDFNGKNGRVVLDDARTSESRGSETRLVMQGEMSEGINNPGRNDPLEHEKQDRDIDSAMALCTPGMFDSEVCYSQAIRSGAKTSMSPDETATPNRSGSDQSRRSSASFSLRLSQSFEEPSDSDLSTRTLAVVAAMEEKQNEIEAVRDEEGSQGPEGFQVDSDISNETVAAIEAMENFEIGQRTNNCDVSVCGGESGFTRVKDRSLGFISKSVPPLNTAAKSHHSPGASTVSRPQVPRAAARVAIEDPKGKQSTDDDSFNIVDVTENREVFNNFLEEWRTKSFSFSVALEKLPHQASRIGRNFNKEAMESTTTYNEVGLSIEEERVVVVGLAVCWKNRDAYFLSLKVPSKHFPAPPFPGRDEGPLRTAPATPHVAAGLTLKERLDSLQVIMGSNGDRQLKTGFAIKDQYKVLSRACGVVVNGQLRDPNIATWLLDPGAKERNLYNSVEHFLPQETSLLQGMNGSYGHGSLGLAAQNSVSARMRSCVEAVLTMKLMDHIHPMLEAEGLLHAFTKIEMPVMSCLARMELNGLGFSNDECEHIKHVLQAKLRTLEQEAYRLANRAFSLASPEEVSRVLFLELKLPPDGNSESSTSPGRPTAVKPTRGGKARKVKYFSTSKDVLQKLLTLHPLPKVILEWRRVNSALTKVVFPVQKEQIHCGPPLNMSRIYSVALTHTATGRVTFVEPNLQNVPRDFDINLPTVISDTPPLHSIHPPAGKKGRKGRPNAGVFIPGDNLVSSSPGPEFSVSMRGAFVPFSGGLLLAADYSQLELRLIAHLSGDGKLLGYLNGGGDVFKMIGGEMFHITQELVSNEQRQRAKQVCYGIIYGIGAKALGLQLSVSENDAMAFVDAFKSRFSGVRRYLKETVDDCRKLGYVTTVSGRKRHLPSIRASNGAAKAHAERQAVNTTVQGSAADLVKLAMANIDRRLCDEFTTCWRTHRQRADGELSGKSTRVGKRARHEGNFRGAYLVLQLHDELLFEVAEEDLRKVVGIVKEEMENAIRLSVNIPVKIKVGKSWGTLEPMEGLG